ncbi:MAG: hypothetical protein QXH51_06520 [Candidatus Bathyarchaeia archaeon]
MKYLKRGEKGVNSRNSILLSFIAILIIALFGTAYSQLQPNSLIYITVEPEKSGLVTFTIDDSILDQWPLGGFMTEKFYFIALPQGKYLYLSVKPYGCYEVLKIDVSPEDIVVKRDKDRVIVHLIADYVNIRVVLYEVPENKCEYYWTGFFRVKKTDVFYGTVIVVSMLASMMIAYQVKVWKSEKKRRREFYEREFERRLKEFMGKFESAKTNNFDYVCDLISMMLSQRYDLDRVEKETLYKALTSKDLDSYFNLLKDSSDIISSFMTHTGMHMMYEFAIGLKTYLSALGLVPSTSRVLEDFLMNRIHTYVVSVDRDRLFDPLIEIVRDRHDIHHEGLRKVAELLTESEEYKYRFYNPHKYYSLVLREIEKETGYKIDLNLQIPKEEKPVIEEPTVKEERREPKKEEKIKRVEREFKIEDERFPEDMKPVIEKLWEMRRKGEPIKKPEEERGEEKPPIELPAYIMRQIQSIKIPVNEMIKSAKRYLEAGRDNKTVFREADRLVKEYCSGMDENSRISILTILTTIIPLIAKEIEQALPKEEEIRETPKEEGKEEKVEEEAQKEEAKKEEAPRKEGMEEKKEEKKIGEKTPEGLKIIDVDYTSRIEIAWGQIYLVPHFKALPSFIMCDMIDRWKAVPIPIEVRKEKIIEEINKASTLGKNPIIVVSKRGYLGERGIYKEYYVNKLKEIIDYLRERKKIFHVGFLMLEKIFFRYDCFGLKDGWGIYRLNLNVPENVNSVIDSLRKSSWIDEKIIDVLLISAILSPKLRDIVRIPRLLEEEVKKARDKGDEEAEAVYWALRKVIDLKRPLLESDIPEEYKKYVKVLKQLRIVKEVKMK